MISKRLILGILVFGVSSICAQEDNIEQMRQLLGLDHIKQDVENRMGSECETVISMVRDLCSKLSPEAAGKMASFIERDAERYEVKKGACRYAPLWYFYVVRAANSYLIDTGDDADRVAEEINQTIVEVSHAGESRNRDCIKEMVTILNRRAYGCE